jgi:hypothetical protein
VGGLALDDPVGRGESLGAGGDVHAVAHEVVCVLERAPVRDHGLRGVDPDPGVEVEEGSRSVQRVEAREDAEGGAHRDRG